MNAKQIANLILCAVICALVILVLSSAGSALTRKGLFRDELPKEVMPGLKLTDYRVREEYGRYVTANFEISNHSGHALRDIMVSCDFLGDDGRFLDRKTWLLPGILENGAQADEIQRDRRYIHNKAVSIDCRISSARIADTPLFKLHRGGGHGAESGHGGEHGHGTPAAHGAAEGHDGAGGHGAPAASH